MADDYVSVSLKKDQALVLFDWLARTAEEGHPVAFDDQAEQRTLWDLGSSLESALSEPLSSDYQERLAGARDRVRDSDA